MTNKINQNQQSANQPRSAGNQNQPAAERKASESRDKSNQGHLGSAGQKGGQQSKVGNKRPFEDEE